MKTNSSEDFSVTFQLLGFFILLFILLIIYKYYVSTYEDNKSMPYSQVYETKPIVNKVRCPPNELRMYKQDDTPITHKNDINNPNTQIQLYKEGENILVDGFEKAVITHKKQEFASELDEVYQQSMAKNPVNNEYSSVKPNKSDLPIANVPYFLLQEDKPLRLSEKPM